MIPFVFICSASERDLERDLRCLTELRPMKTSLSCILICISVSVVYTEDARQLPTCEIGITDYLDDDLAET